MMRVKRFGQCIRGRCPYGDTVTRSRRTDANTAHAAADVRPGALLGGHSRFGCLNVGGVMQIIGAAGPVAHAFQLYKLSAYLRTSDSRTGILSVSSDREGERRRVFMAMLLWIVAVETDRWDALWVDSMRN